MKKYLLKKENIIILLLGVCIALALLINNQSLLHFNFQYTYFIVSIRQFSEVLFIYTLLVYAIYYYFRRKNWHISGLVVFIQISGLFLFSIIQLFYINQANLAGAPRYYYDSTYTYLRTIIFSNKIKVVATLYFIVSQLFYFFYAIIAFIKQLIKKS
ncbi:hypothetical protein FRZ67_10840 [Panacibacter ginsenosidivorans]|uniref:Uncharacterized protein n=1 Tax=Panacibacter ginsenosidivorans TaxID=1813871 RepID=A0A5B8VBW9_9BACT|nr:hypothetical protein [Panacibacter ginsenosidivorans]QEC67768.1 hypothetical protein FRZ67_10840 [Panacibacter ginsenosidivorans]